ncbi:MAG: hypothetical protein JSV00_03550, partial [bacterium]
MKRQMVILLLASMLALPSCNLLQESDRGPASVQVNSLGDAWPPPEGEVTLRSAVHEVASGGTVTFAPDLDGGTVELSRADADHSILRGEVFVMAGGWVFQGYQERDYGRSALYVRKDLTVDASGLPSGVTIAWAGSASSPARVMAVYGDLTLKNVTVTSGWSRAEPLASGPQPWTLGRGGGLAVWGVATLENCTIHGNQATGDVDPSRDRGSFGGGVYAERVVMTDCVVSGNSVTGYGAAGGGVYSVGGTTGTLGSSLTRCAVSGNRVTGQHAYGGGVYSDGGGPGRLMPVSLASTTLARNAVGDHPDIAESAMAQYYYRGGGFYMSNGYLILNACTVVENEVTGNPAVFGGKPNMGGGGIAATIGNAHVVESMAVRHSIVTGNTVGGAPGDLFTGSLRDFYSDGGNLIGDLDFRYMLVPIPWWNDLSRRHWPKALDAEGVDIGDALSLAEAVTHPSVLSTGVGAGQPAVLYYPPTGQALDRIPATGYAVTYVKGEYSILPGQTDDFLNQVLDKLRTEYADVLGAQFGTEFGDMTGVTFYGPAVTWPGEPANEPWITFWHDLDAAIGDSLGAVGLGDEFWGTFSSGPMGGTVYMSVSTYPRGTILPTGLDQLGNPRPYGAGADAGA